MTSKVIVVDDSAFMRSEIKKILHQDPRLKVIATAENGLEALRQVKIHRPDVVTMDINMPVMDGLTSLKRIMKEAPCPVVMVSALTADSADETIEALASGAFDFFQKPSGSISVDISLQADTIRKKVRTAALSKRQPQGRKKLQSKGTANRSPVTKLHRVTGVSGQARITEPCKIAAIGVSTGGPKTLLSILPNLPADFQGTVIIVQHMPEKFTLSFANRLDTLCSLPVNEAQDGEMLQNGKIYIAPGGRHLRIVNRENDRYEFEVGYEPGMSAYIPSVEVLFRSLLESVGNQWIGVMLTGMGSDGAQALSELRKLGGHTIAESEESCVVFGMPRKVIEKEGAEFTLHQDRIASKLVELIGYSVCH